MPDRINLREKGVSRRLLLKSIPVVAGGVMSLTAESRNALAQTKLTHDVAKYQEQPKNGQKCSTCVQFQPPSSCKIVADPISPNGWCQYYAAKTG